MAAQLPVLPEVERLSPACIRILGGNPGHFTLQGTNTYLLGTGRERLLVDTGGGQPSWEAALTQTLAAEQATLAAALITHWHPDHVGGIDQVRRVVPGVPVYQSREGRSGVHGTAGTVDTVHDIVDQQEFCVEGASLRAVHTPGHATNHMVFVLAEEPAVLAGDNVLGHGTAVFEDLAVYLRSLARMLELYDTHGMGRRLYPGHGPVVADGPAKIAEYIAHRQQREDQVVRLLRTEDGPVPWTPRELVEVIYANTSKDLHPAAERGLVQILAKLESEGKAMQNGGRWALRERSPL